MPYEFPFGLAGSVLICPFLGGMHTYERLLKPFPWKELETLKKALKEIEDLWKKGPYEAKDTITDTVFFQCEKKRRPLWIGPMLQNYKKTPNNGRICIFLVGCSLQHMFLGGEGVLPNTWIPASSLAGDFKVTPSQEDGHTAIEQYITEILNCRFLPYFSSP